MKSPLDTLAEKLAMPLANLIESRGNDTDDGIFIDTFCRPDLSPEDFQNQLGAFTPCFIDIAVLSEIYLSLMMLKLNHSGKHRSCVH